MKYRTVDDAAYEEDLSRSMQEREAEADIEETTRRLIDNEMDAIEAIDEVET